MKPTLEEGNRLLCIDEYNAENKEIKFDVENQKLQVDFGDGTGYHEIGGGDTPSGDAANAPEYDRTKTYPQGSYFKAPQAYINGEPNPFPERVYFVQLGELPAISDEDWQIDFVQQGWQTLTQYFGNENVPGLGSFPKLVTVATMENLPTYGPDNAQNFDIVSLATRKAYIFGSSSENFAQYGYNYPYKTAALVRSFNPETHISEVIYAPHGYIDVKNGRLYADGGLGNSLARVSLSLPAVSWEANSDAETSTAYPYKITVNQSVGNKFRENFASGEISIIPSLTAAQSVAGDIAFVVANSIVYNDASDVATLQFTVYSKNNSAPASDIDFKAVIIVDHDFDESVFDNINQ